MADQQLFLETDLIRQAQKGNNAAYGELYTQHLAAIQHYIQKRIGESSDVEDLTQTVFVKAWQALRDYQPSGAPFRAWLYRIAHNAVVDYYRTQRHALFWDDLTWIVDPQATPEGRALDSERQETVRKAVADLRPTYQAVVERRFLQELDYTETAGELGQQVNHVRVVQHRALDALRRLLAHDSVLWLTTVVTVLSLLLSGKIVVAAEQALPGDRLYAMRTWVEETRLLLADEATAVTLHTRFATQRITALDTLYQQGRSADMGTAIAAAASHIRAASAQFATVDAGARRALTTEFAAALQSQSASLQALAQVAPQTLPALQPALVALTTAQSSLQTDDVQLTPTVTPAATATRLLVPTPVATVAAVLPVQHHAADELPVQPTVAAVEHVHATGAATHNADPSSSAKDEKYEPPATAQPPDRPAAAGGVHGGMAGPKAERTPLTDQPTVASPLTASDPHRPTREQHPTADAATADQAIGSAADRVVEANATLSAASPPSAPLNDQNAPPSETDKDEPAAEPQPVAPSAAPHDAAASAVEEEHAPPDNGESTARQGDNKPKR